MHCPNCEKEITEGVYCPQCGENTPKENFEETTEVIETPSSPEDTTGKLKSIYMNFSHFCITLVKQPSAAKKANKNDATSAIITITIFSLVIALIFHLVVNTISFQVLRYSNFGNSFGGFNQYTGVPFTDSMIIPFIVFAALFFIITAFTFICTKLLKQHLVYLDILAKYGAYLVPFSLLFMVGIILNYLRLSPIGFIVLFISIIGIFFIAPTLVLSVKEASGVDYIYILIGLYTTTIITSLLLIKIFLGPILTQMLEGLLSNFFSGF